MLSPVELRPVGSNRQYQTISLAQGARQQVVLRLVDPTGAPVDLIHESTPGTAPNFAGQRTLTPLNASVRLRARISRDDPRVAFDIQGKILQDDPTCEACQGVVQFELTEADSLSVGLFWAEIGLFSEAKYLVQSWPVLVQIRRSVFSSGDAPGPISIPEVRYDLNDVPGLEVALLDDVEFSDERILQAIERVVDMWNETPPPIAFHTSQTFPYRHYWIIATTALLLRSAAASYRRNNLEYSAGGISIRDQAKGPEYEAIAKERMDEFREWMKNEKVRINMRKAWGSYSV